MIDIALYCSLLAFSILRILNGKGKISDIQMCGGMAMTFALSTGRWESLAMFPALLWAYSYGWSFSAIHGHEPWLDWSTKFRQSGDLINVVSRKITNSRVLGALGWLPRIFMTFWLPCAVAGNVWGVVPLALLWGWCYWMGGVIGRLAKRDIGPVVGDALTGLMLGAVLCL